jgi:hypothetical protein
VKIGRNDPCPCGSGKKYKRCCLAAEGAQVVDDTGRESGEARTRDAAIGALARFGGRREFDEARAEAERVFSGGRELDLRAAELDDDVGVKFAFFFLFDFGIPGRGTIAQAFLARQGQALPVRQERLLQRLSRARLRLYEVEEVRVDEGLRLRDVRTGEEFRVSERSATHQIQRWDVLAARVAADGEGALRLEGGIYLLPVASKTPLLEAVEAEERRLRRGDPGLDDDTLWRRCAPLVHHYWLDHVVARPMPKMVTAEGDPMAFGKIAFDVLDEPAVRSALERHPDLVSDEDGSYTWTEETPEFRRTLGRVELRADGRLVLEVTSRRRGERGRALLEQAAGGALRHRSTRFESVEKALEKHRSAPARPAEEIPPEVAAEVIRQYKDRHYKTWPDTPLPGLAGRTPRESAGLPVLRPRLVDLLKDMENMEARGASRGSPAYDFGWMWTELGLERPR